MSPPQTTSSGSGARVPASSKDAAVVTVSDGAEANAMPAPPPPACPVCLEPWTCVGAHRICCIPCGHVYGRSCLETWLHRSASALSAKCPQCGEQFEDKVIINLYAPENLWVGCLQELEARLNSRLKKTEGWCMSVLNEHREKIDLELNKVRAELKQLHTNMNAERESFRAEAEQMSDKLAAMKERMRKMAEEENATAKDLIEFVELIFPHLLPVSIHGASAPAPAPVDYGPDPSGPGDAVKRRRRRM